MIRKLRSLFSVSKDPSPQEKAKAVYFVLISQGKIIVQDILNSSPEQFKNSQDFEAFLGNEVGVIMCLTSTREGYERFFRNIQDSKLFSATLLKLFREHLQISWKVFEQYINLGEITKEPDKIFFQLFACRIIAFLNRDDDIFTNGNNILIKYVSYPEVLIYNEIYVSIFKMVHLVLNDYAGRSANNKKILKMAKKIDECLR